MFSREEEPPMRQRIAQTLLYVVSQRLVANIGQPDRAFLRSLRFIHAVFSGPDEKQADQHHRQFHRGQIRAQRPDAAQHA